MIIDVNEAHNLSQIANFRKLRGINQEIKKGLAFLAWLSKIWKTLESQGIKSWLGKTWKSQGILLKEQKMLMEINASYTETRPGANFSNISGQNDKVTLRCVLLMQNTLLYMHNISWQSLIQIS